MTSFNMADYDNVANRLLQWHKDHPNARIWTEPPQLVDVSPDPSRKILGWLCRAVVFTEADNNYPFATGQSFNLISESYALEKCETSAIGRALANANYPAKIGNGVDEVDELGKGAYPNPHRVQGGGGVVPAYPVEPTQSETQSAGQSNPDGWNEKPKVSRWDHRFTPPTCFHGERKFITGTRNGKDWGGYMCPQPKDAPDKCEPVWATFNEVEREWVI